MQFQNLPVSLGLQLHLCMIEYARHVPRNWQLKNTFQWVSCIWSTFWQGPWVPLCVFSYDVFGIIQANKGLTQRICCKNQDCFCGKTISNIRRREFQWYIVWGFKIYPKISRIYQSNPTIRSKKKNLGNPMPIVVRSASNPLISLNLNVLVDWARGFQFWIITWSALNLLTTPIFQSFTLSDFGHASCICWQLPCEASYLCCLNFDVINASPTHGFNFKVKSHVLLSKIHVYHVPSQVEL